MRLREVTIKNFKAIEDATLKLADFNVIVGMNGSGKSSVLQALHWMFQSAQHHKIDPPKGKNKGATISENDATFMPTPEYRNASHGSEYGNKQNTPQFDVKVKAVLDDGQECSADMWLKSARNAGITVHVPSNNSLVLKIRDKTREISAYIPGLAGIPLTEEKRSKLIVQKLAAAGDANTVLRNVLHLLHMEEENGMTKLDIVQKYVSKVMGKFSIDVKFDDNKDTRIIANFQTEEMKKDDNRRFKPLELAGIGFLQVIQIFAYLVYFRPILLLVDEPDAHLHPTAQEKLVKVLADAASSLDTQVIITTHSPSVMRAIPNDAQIIWMKDGKVQPGEKKEARGLMGWGLLDRRILLMTEDGNTEQLRAILAQWEGLERVTAIWPYHGTAKLPPAEVIKGLHDLLGATMKIVIHRDRDFLMPNELNAISKPYKDNKIELWFTKCSDIEAYWAEIPVIAAHFDLDTTQATELLNSACAALGDTNELLPKIRRKRDELLKKIPDYKDGDLTRYGDSEFEKEAKKHGDQHLVLGKDLLTAICKTATNKEFNKANSFGKTIPAGLQTKIASDLEEILWKVLESSN